MTAGNTEPKETKLMRDEDGKLRRVPVPAVQDQRNSGRVLSGVFMLQVSVSLLSWMAPWETPRWLYWSPLWAAFAGFGLYNIARGASRLWKDGP